MREHLSSLGDQIKEALQIGGTFSCPKPEGITRVFFCGMGGSGISGDILRVLAARKGAIPFEVHRSGFMPGGMNRSTLVILSSYSGNTIETLEVLENALRSGAKILAVSSGGKVAERAAQKKIPLIRIPAGMAPRCAIGYLTFSLLPILKKWGWIDFSSTDITEVLKGVNEKIRTRTPARSIARKMLGKAVRFYGASGHAEPILGRWRAQLAENSKMLSSFNYMPEMFHNEIEGWQFPKEIIRRSLAVFFWDEEVPGWLQKKMVATKRYLQSQKVPVLDLKSTERSFLARIFSLMNLGDWVSYELAILHGIDPMGIPVIESIKKIK